MSSSKSASERQADQLETKVLEMIAKAAKPRSAADQARDEVLHRLDELGGQQLGDDSIIFSGNMFVLPESLDGNIKQAIVYLAALAEAEEVEFEISQTFPYRPWDGAAAFQRAMLRLFGTVGVGKAVHSFFGTEPPQYRTVDTGLNETIQVPWGRVEFTPMNATFDLGTVRTESGLQFRMSVTAPRKHRRRVEGFLQVIADELKQRSIYRGKAIDAGENPGFVDLSMDPKKVVYTEAVMRQLEVNIWSVLRYSKELRAQHQSLKRAVLLEGPYGSGKTLSGVLTGQEAVKAGWTFIQVRAGDDPYMALETARLYAPAVVWIEDIDVLFAGKSRDEVSKLLDALDNVQNKGAEVMCGFTTNFREVLEKGVLRPGRIDAVIHIGELDAEAQERLVKAVVPGAQLSANIDWKQVTDAFGDFLPSFSVEAVNRALRYALVRGGGAAKPLSTADLVDAAADLQPQLKLLKAAEETRHSQATLGTHMEEVITAAVTKVLNRTEIDEDVPKLMVKASSNGVH